MPGVCFCQDLDIDYISHFNFTCTRCAANLPSTTIKRLSFKRRPRGASDHEETNVASSSQWHSADSLSNKRGAREVATQGRPPLPPPHSSTDKKTSRSKTKLLDTEATQSMGEKDKLDIEVKSPRTPPQPLPRRRLASFGGLSSPESSSIFTGLGAYSQFKGVQHPAATGNISECSGSSLGSTQSLKVSPHSSGRSTPVTGSVQLLNVRDQMVAALQKLKELEEQVKLIPALELNISELQEEKKVLSVELEKHRKQDPDALWKTDKDKCVLCCEHQCKSKGKEITTDLGSNTEKDDLLSIQQELIYSLKERICYLEAELKESALQIEMNRLKLELQAAEQRHLKKMDKASSAVPSTADSSTEARPSTTNQGVGNHVNVCDASTGEVTLMKSVGISCCRMKLQNVRAGPGVQWVVREMVETADKNTGVEILTTSQGVGTCIKLCDTGSNTDKLWSDNDQCADEGNTASPVTVSQDTNTVRNLVSRFTNTKQPFITDSITNTVIKSQDKHTNTPATVTRTVSVGSRVQDIQPPTQTRTIGVGTSHYYIDSDPQNPNCKLTRDASVGIINIHENFLIGIKTRNMASGPSHLPDPFKTRSVGVGDGRISESPTKERSEVAENQSMKDTELNFYIEEMERFLTEHKDLLKDDTKTISNQHESSLRNASPTQSGKITQEGNGGVLLDPSEPTNRESREMCPEDDNCTGAKPNEVKRMIKMLEKQTWNSLEDKAAKDTNPWSVCKRKNTDQSCSTSRRNMRLMGVTTRLDPISSNFIDAVEMMGKNDSANIKKNKGGRNDKLSSRKLLKAPAKYSKHESFRVKLSEKFQIACQQLMVHLSEDKDKRTKDFKETIQTLKQEWFNITGQRSAAPDVVKDYLCALREVSPVVLQHVVNMTDGNGNTALHYCVSHSNFSVVRRLLNTNVCSVNQQNKAGYTPIMLAALAALASPEDMIVVKELFSKGNVNAKASQAGQTALMLASSHGSLEMVNALLEQGAEVNLQDDEGSTALMCASEHGHQDIVKLLLQQPHCDATLTDGDDSTALSIALEGGHKEIAVLLYAHANFSKGNSGNSCPASPSPPGRRKCFGKSIVQ